MTIAKEVDDNNFELITINATMDDQENDNGFPGFLSLIQRYLNGTEMEDGTQQTLFNYLNLISKRAREELMIIIGCLKNQY